MKRIRIAVTVLAAFLLSPPMIFAAKPSGGPGGGGGGGGKTTTSRAIVTISDSATDPFWSVFSDGSGEYPDYQVASIGTCVAALVTDKGYSPINFNRQIDGSPCLQSHPTWSRSYTLRVHDAGACAALSATFDDGAGYCTVTQPDRDDLVYSIRSNMFDASGSTSFGLNLPAYGFTIETDGPATVTAQGQDTRIATYSSTARIWQNYGFRNQTAVSGSFPFHFQITISRAP